jgi:hypothetical protein
MILLKVKDGIQEGNQDFLLVLVAKDFPKSDVVLYVCEFHIKQFVTKIQKPLGLAAVPAALGSFFDPAPLQQNSMLKYKPSGLPP